MKIGYARVSTSEQDPELQITALKAEGCERIYVDRISGATKNRPELDAMMAALRHGDTVVVWKLDRLGRSVRNLIDLVETFHQTGVDFVCVTDKIDTSTAAGRLFFTIAGAFAEYERSIISERTLAGLAVARKHGRVGGNRPKLNSSRQAQARAMLGQDIPIRDICDTLGVSRQTLYRYIPGGRSAVEGTNQEAVSC